LLDSSKWNVVGRVNSWGCGLEMGTCRPYNYARISDALISSGYVTLDQQAKALGLGRSTTWNITKNKHKLGRLSGKTIGRILTNPQTPPAVRAVVQQYLAERRRAVQKKRNRLTPFLTMLARTNRDLF
jgi:hypothetical protein